MAIAYKWCIVPFCRSTSLRTPDKIFITVPKNEKLRMLWFEAMRRNIKEISLKSTVFCCQDHFDLPNDMENWMKHSFMKCRIRMSKNIIPHIFNCQPGRECHSSGLKINAAIKRQHMAIISDLLFAPSISDTSTNLINTLYLENEIYERNADDPSAPISINDHSYSLARWLCVSVSQATQTFPSHIEVPYTPEEIKLKTEIEILERKFQRREKYLKNLQDVLERLSEQPPLFDNLLEVSSSNNRYNKKKGCR